MCIFYKFGSPSFLLKKAGSIISAYYQPSSIEVIKSSENSAVLHIIEFVEIDTYIENRMGDWMKEALRISGCDNAKVEITKSMTRKDAAVTESEYTATW